MYTTLNSLEELWYKNVTNLQLRSSIFISMNDITIFVSLMHGLLSLEKEQGN